MQFGIDPTKPQALTLEGLENQLLESLLGSTPLAPLLPILTPQINSLLGLSGQGWRNPVLDSVMISNMSPYGTYVGQLQSNFNRVANDALNRQSNAARRGWLENISRTMMSFESWKKTDLGQQMAAEARSDKELRQYYEDYITNEAAGRDNFITRAGYQFLDPEGFEASRKYLSQAGANLIRNSSIQGRRSAYMQAKAVGKLFIGDDGKYNYKAADYGYMNVGEASAVAAAITTDTDLFNDAGFDADKIKDATTKLRDRIKEYTKALSPLKDVFGTDIPAMIKAVEELSGQRLSQLDPSRMGQMVSRVMAGATVGGYTVGQVVNMRNHMASAIGKMDVPFINDMGALAQGATVLDATVTGYAPAAMSLQRYQNNVGEWTLRTSNSSGAEYLNLAYAVWKQQNPEKTFEDFQQEYNTKRGEMNADAAILSMAGASDFYNLRNAGYQSKYFLEAVQDDIGGRMARTENLKELIGRGYMQAYGSQRDDYTTAIDLIQKDTRLLTDNAYLESYKLENGDNLSENVIKQVQAIKNGFYGAELVTALHADAELRRKQPLKDAQIKLRTNLENLKIAIPDSFKAAISDFLGGRGDLASLVTNSHAMMQADEETRTMMEDIAMAAQDQMGRTLEENATQQEKQEWLTNQLSYGITNGYTNELYTEELIRYSDAKKTFDKLHKKKIEDKEELTDEELNTYEDAQNVMRYASRGMYVSQFVDQEVVSDFVGTDNNKKSALLEVFDKALEKSGATSEAAGQEVMDYIVTSKITDQMKDRNFATRFSKLDDAFRQELEKKQSELGALDRSDVMDIIDNLQKDDRFKGTTELAFQTLKNFTNNAFNESGGAETDIQDLFGIITKAIERMGSLSDEMKKVLGVVEKSAEDPGVESARREGYYHR